MLPEPERSPRQSVFRTTRWTVVFAAGSTASEEAHEALSQLCQAYWYPLYCCVRRHGYSPEQAQDLTQGFLGKLLGKNQVALADPERGRFRTFLLRSLENFLRSEHRDATTRKRGGSTEIVSWDAEAAEDRYICEQGGDGSPAALFEKQWAGAVLEAVMADLRRDFSARGR